MYKALIVGNGIAGLSLAWRLDQAGAQVTLVSDPTGARSTGAAAGVINPVTGKRFAKSWRFEDFHPEARTFYQSLEQRFSICIWREREIVRLLGSPEEANNWSSRACKPEFNGFMTDEADAGPWTPFIQDGLYNGRILQSAQVDFQALTGALTAYFQDKNAFRQERLTPEHILQETAHYDAVVCCEGAGAAANPWFDPVPWQPAKGEGILVEFQDESLRRLFRETAGDPAVPMLKKDIAIAAPGFFWDGLCWVGASYSWNFSDHLPAQESISELTASLKKMIKSPFEVHGQFAGIRQVAKDRRPVLGESNVHPRIFIFNGLGSKGGLLAPYWSGNLAAHLLEGTALDPEGDVRRFYSRR